MVQFSLAQVAHYSLALTREAAYVIDGLMENSVVKSEIHSTDTDGYSEVIFGVTHFLSIFSAPRIKGIKHQVLSMFPAGYKVRYRGKGYKILPTHVINVKIIKEFYDEILRFMATIKLKRSTASQLLSRLNSYSTQHKLYQALKEFGKIIKSIFILKYLDDVKLRQSIEKQLSLIENNNKFSKAIAQENDQSFMQQTQEEQIMAESCRRLMKVAIICWNCLYLYKIMNKEQQKDKRMGAPRKVRKEQSVKIRSIQSLTNGIEPTIALHEVTSVMKPIGGTYQAATQVKVLSPENYDIIEADVLHSAEGSMKGGDMVSHHSLYRGLSPWHDMRWNLRKLGRSSMFSKEYARTSQNR